MPVMGLGSWGLKNDPANAIANGLKLGYRMVDTSGDYGSQPYVGQGVRESGISREEVFVITKVEEDEESYVSAQKQVQELGLGYANLILIHRPPENDAGVELWKGLIRARDEGIAHDIGVSNYKREQIEELIDETGEVPVVNQIEWTPFGHSDEMRGFLRNQDIALMAYSSLTHGKRLTDPRLKDVAEKYNKTPAQIILRWDIERGVVPIVKANKIEHMRENLGVFDFELDDEDVEVLNELNEHYSALGSRIEY